MGIKKKNREENNLSKTKTARTWLNSNYDTICVFLSPLTLPPPALAVGTVSTAQTGGGQGE